MNFIPHLKGSDWKEVIKRKWWVNQQRAVETVVDYLADKPDRQAMVRMPTGTGKTVVIATLAQLVAGTPRCLVIAPWENLVKQLQREIYERLWKKLGEDAAIKPKSCEVFTPSNSMEALKTVGDSGVLLCTNQTLQALWKSGAAFKKLRKWCTLVLVDEGHREPAPRWAEAVRGLDCPTVLFTATPYRNDLQLFDVDPKFFYSFTFGEALDERIVRQVTFIDGSWNVSGANVVTNFVDQFLKSVESVQKQLGIKESEVKAIVRCETAADIKNVVAELQARGHSPVGVHERFKASEGKPFRKIVPDPDVETARFWIHQNKLIEGLDDPTFRLIAIFSPFANARNLVQQVGRVIRNPGCRDNQSAFVLANTKHRQKELWNRFLEYEDDIRQRNSQGITELSAFEDFIAARTKAPRFYFLGDFRKHLQPEDIKDPRDVVRMRKSVLIRSPKPGFKWKQLILGIQHELLTGDASPYGTDYRDQSTFLQLFQISDQSDIVTEAFLETRLGYTVVKLERGLLFFFDSEGRAPDYLRKSTSPVLPEILQRLLPDTRSTIKEVSLINGDFGNHSFRRRVLSTASLQIVPPSLSDYVHVCSTATGSVKELVAGEEESRRRYLSFTRARLSERTTPVSTFTDFEAWLAEMATQLVDLQAVGDDTLARFAKPHKYDGTEQPTHILFDITHENIDATNMATMTMQLSLDKLWLVKNGRFFGEIDEDIFEAGIRYNPETERFEIESDQLDGVSIITTDGKRMVFTNYLNESQNFRILLGPSIVYTQGKFFTPNLLPWRGGGSRLNIQKIVVGCKGLENIESEKGGNTGWSKDSVFGAITDKTQVFESAGWEPQILICNDVGAPEIADYFGLCEQTKKIVMIHAKKARKGSTLSASAFHEVCSQAVRYLGFFNPADTRTKLTKEKITADWCPDPAKHPKLKRLVWHPNGLTPIEIVRKFDSALADPTFSREVWLVMGNGLSQDAFAKAVEKRSPQPNEREISYLFQSTWCAVASVGASLKVVCMR